MKQFLIILGLTIIVWLGVSMTETDSYTLPVRVEMTGYDTLRYAVVRADTAVTLRIECNGYNALLHSIRSERPTLRVDMSTRQAVAGSEICEIARHQLMGLRNASTDKDSLRLILAERSQRTYRPLLDDVEFAFAEQYGLYGEPSVSPAEVTLYGPASDLQKIDELRIEATTIDGISASGSYRLRLQPEWENYADVHPSVKEVDVYVPTETYVEREYKVPIQVVDADNDVELHLYPEVATLHVWVAQRDLEHMPEFEVTIDYADVVAHRPLTPRLTKFPTYLRPRSLEPAEVQCVVIR